MAKDTKVFTIAFESKERVSNRSVIEFFRKIESLMLEDYGRINRVINNKPMRVHAYYWADNKSFVVIPFGKLKTGDKPFGINYKNQQLKDIAEDMFDVTLLAYHSVYNIALLTVNTSGPREGDIENYLNSYIAPTENYRIRLRPVLIYEGIEEVRRAVEARNIRIDLDLGRPLHDCFKDQVVQKKGIGEYLRGLTESAKDTLDSLTFTLTLGLGHTKKATLNVPALLELLDYINIESGNIKDVSIAYRSRAGSPLSRAYIKKGTIILKIPFSVTDRIAPEYLKYNLEEKLNDYQDQFYRQVNAFFANTQTVGDEYEFILEYSDEESPI